MERRKVILEVSFDWDDDGSFEYQAKVMASQFAQFLRGHLTERKIKWHREHYIRTNLKIKRLENMERYEDKYQRIQDIVLNKDSQKARIKAK